MSSWLQVHFEIQSKIVSLIKRALHFSIIAKSKGLQWKNINKFAALQKELGCSLDELNEFADTILSKDLYTLSDILNVLDISEIEFQDTFLSANTKGMKKFNLRSRALHVIQGK